MRFRAESLRALRQELEALDGGLWLSSEEPVYAVNRIQQQYSVITLVCDEPVATEERLEVARLEAEGYPTVPVFVDDLFRFEQLPFDLDELPATFSKFRKVVEKKPSL
jgi:deoxyribodipyrimidine photo-lyase